MTVSAAIFLSRITGFLRDMVFAGIWGTGIAMGAFTLAFKIPNLFRALFGEGALTSAFIPVFTRRNKEQGRGEAIKFAGNIITVTAVMLSLLTALLILISFCLRSLFPSPLATLTLQLLPWLLPFTVLICVSALLGAILNSFSSFLIPALMSSLFNLVLIATAWLVSPLFGDSPEEKIKALAIGVIAGGILQVLILLHTLANKGVKIRPDFNVGKEFNYVMKLATPALIGAGLYQFNSLIDSILAGFIGGHAISSLYFSQRIIYLPVGIFAVALGTVALPTMSRAAAANDIPKLKESLTFSLRTILFLTIPCSIFLIFFARETVMIIFERGSFDSESTKQTLKALFFYLPGIPFFAASKVIIPAFHSRLDIKTPIKTAGFCVVLNLILNLILMQFLDQGGLALATTISSGCNCFLLLFFLGKDTGALELNKITRATTTIFAASITALIIAGGVYNLMISQEINLLFSTACGLGIGGISYIIVVKLLKLPEADIFLSRLRKN